MVEKKVTSYTVFTDLVGLRISIVYSYIDTDTETIIDYNKRKDIVITNNTAKKKASDLMDYANTFLGEDK